MKIMSLDVYNYKRFTLNPEMKHIQFKPNKKLTLILGDNGAGKSSFLDLLCPRVVPIKEFNQGGYCRLTFELSDDIYTLSTESNGYSFTKNGTELNETGGIRQQHDLINNLLNMDVIVQAILTGSTKFSQLSVNQRRELMELLSGSDYGYVTHVYKQAYRRMKDANAVIDFTEEQLLRSLSQLEEISDSTELVEEKIKILEEELKVLFLRTGEDTDASEEEIEEKLGGIRDAQDKVKRLHNKVLDIANTRLHIGSYHRLDAIHDNLTQKISKIAGKKDLLTSQHYELNQTIQGGDEDISVEDIKSTLKEVRECIKDHKYHLVTDGESKYEYPDPVQAKTTIDTLANVLDNLDTIDDRDYQLYRDDYVNEVKLDTMGREVQLLSHRINGLKEDIEHYRSLRNDKHTCPKCQHQWIEGYDEKTYKDMQEELKDLNTEYNTLTTRQLAMIDAWSRIQPFSVAKTAFDTLRTDIKTTILPLYNEIKERLKTTTRGINKIIANHQLALGYLIDMNDIKNQESVLVEKLKTYDDIAVDKRKVVEERLNSLLQDIKTLRISERVLRKRLDVIDWLIRSKKQIMQLLKEIDDLGSTLLRLLSEYTANINNQVSRIEIHNKNIEVNRLRMVYTNKIRLTEKITELKATLKDKQHEVFISKRLMQITNPKGELVAQSMVRFLNAFIEEMNDILSKVWHYPLEILPLAGDIESITYRFKFKTGSSVRDDISQASQATADIMDIAFKMVAMNALNLNHFPLYLDELGEGYDDAHKISLCKVVDAYIMKQDYTHIFIVAQVKAIYEYFNPTNSDRVVLSSNNMEIDDTLQALCVL